MTCLSRSWRRVARQVRALRAFRAWHGACFLLPLSGCIYFGPIPDVAEGNVQPQIKSRSFEVGETIEVGTGGQEVFVIVTDAEDDPVAFVWYYEDGGLIGDATPFYNTGEPLRFTSYSVTSGASAPESLVKGVIEVLRGRGATSVRELEGEPENMTFALPKELRLIQVA